MAIYWRIALVVALLLVIGLVIRGTIFTREDPLRILQDNVLADSTILNKIQITNSTMVTQTIDPSYSLSARITPELARSLVSKQILKACIDDSDSRCSSPAWIRYDSLGSTARIGAPHIEIDTEEVACTFTWKRLTSDGLHNYQDMVCINPNSGEFWYEYFEV